MNSKIEKVKELLKDKKVAIAFSGGSDSTLLCYLAKKVSADVLAITVNNNLFNSSFCNNCKEIAEKLKVKHIILEEDFYKYPEIIKNDSNRCYLCRNKMYSSIIKKAEEEGFDLIVDGNNISDLVLDRPGIIVNYEKNITSPFIEAKLESFEIKKFLNENNINYSKSTTCLATRFKGKITKEKIQEIDELENIVYENSKCEIVKIRKNNEDYVCEVDDITKFDDKVLFKLINDSLNKKKDSKVHLNMRSIKNNDSITIDKNQDVFRYQLPYKIDIQKTKFEIENRIAKSDDSEIMLKDNILITEKGLITSQNMLKKEEFIKVLVKIRRKL